MKFKCDQCDKTFKREGWLRQHVALAHNGVSGQRTEISISLLVEERNVLYEKARFIDELLEKFAR